MARFDFRWKTVSVSTARTPAKAAEPGVRYLAGLGEDASFDLRLIEQFGCAAHSFDPVPEARRYAESVAAQEPRFSFRPIGLWSSDTTLRLYDHTEPGFVSRSSTSLMPGGWKLTFCSVPPSARSPTDLRHASKADTTAAYGEK